MFGDTPPVDGVLSQWCRHFDNAEPDTARGALVLRNILSDGNVCADYREAFCALVQRHSAVLTPEDAARVYNYVLTQLDAMGCGFCDGPNRVNQMEAVPFPELAHVADVKSSAKWNVLGNDRAPRHLYDGSRGLGIALSQVRRRRGDVRMLKGTVGGGRVYATNAAVLEPDLRELRSDEVRDSLGLDDGERFGKGACLVVTVYESSLVSGRGCYRPTVLDAGWGPISGAFLPSPAGPVEPGLTQHLEKGEPCLPEVIHEPVPANHIRRYNVLGPLRSDPSTQYRARRLAVGPR